MNIDNIKKLFKFSWSQACSDHNGKSSILPVAGAYIIFIGGLCFAYDTYMKDISLLTQAIIWTGIGSGLLMGRKLVNGKSPNDLMAVESDPPPEEVTDCTSDTPTT